MTHRTLILSLISGLVLGTGACSSTLEPTGSAISQQDGVGVGSSVPDDKGGLTGGQSTDDPAGDDRGGLTGGNGADDPAGDNHGGNGGGHGHGGADDPANHR